MKYPIHDITKQCYLINNALDIKLQVSLVSTISFGLISFNNKSNAEEELGRRSWKLIFNFWNNVDLKTEYFVQNTCSSFST